MASPLLLIINYIPLDLDSVGLVLSLDMKTVSFAPLPDSNTVLPPGFITHSAGASGVAALDKCPEPAVTTGPRQRLEVPARGEAGKPSTRIRLTGAIRSPSIAL